MLNGTGAANSLWEEAKRFGQRAIADFFDGQHREFVIDAGAAVEYLAKVVVANSDPTRLYPAGVRAELTDDELFILWSPRTSIPRPGPDQFDAALDRLVERETISGAKASRIANGAEFLRGQLDHDAMDRLRTGRNRGLHIGEYRGDADSLAADFLTVVNTMRPKLGRGLDELWGFWNPVATSSYLSSTRAPAADAAVRAFRAWSDWYHRSPSIGRLSQFRLAAETRQRPCPICGNTAGLSTAEGGLCPPLCVTEIEKRETIDVLDCLHCNLTLYGEQIVIAGTLPISYRG